MHEPNRARSKENFESPVDLHPGDILVPANNVDAARGGAQYICGPHYKESVDHLSTAPYQNSIKMLLRKTSDFDTLNDGIRADFDDVTVTRRDDMLGCRSVDTPGEELAPFLDPSSSLSLHRQQGQMLGLLDDSGVVLYVEEKLQTSPTATNVTNASCCASTDTLCDPRDSPGDSRHHHVTVNKRYDAAQLQALQPTKAAIKTPMTLFNLVRKKARKSSDDEKQKTDKNSTRIGGAARAKLTLPLGDNSVTSSPTNQSPVRCVMTSSTQISFGTRGNIAFNFRLHRQRSDRKEYKNRNQSRNQQPLNLHHHGNRHERPANKREKKATKTLAIVLGVYLLCWAPFFTINIINAICIRYSLKDTRPECSLEPKLFSFFVWLGYINSFLNPIIYTIFNVDFRRAFRTILQHPCSRI